jgi:glycosyltransferase involved in cell wall biosynthesis
MRVVIFDKNDVDNSGATHTLKSIIRLLVSKGHSITVILEQKPTKPNYDGQSVLWQHYADKVMKTTDLVIAQHYPCGSLARQLNRYGERPIVYICNFTEQFEYLAKDKMKYEELLVCMSDAMKEKFSAYDKLNKYKFMTLYPKVSVANYRKREPWTVGEERKKYITFINSNFIKGAHLFYEIAKKMPERNFKVVKAYYLSNIVVNLPNIKFVDYGNVDDVYEDTYLLLCPSLAESWSRVSNEAMANGIPVLYSEPYVTNKNMTTEGMAECVGTGGIGLPHDKVEDWIEAINNFDDELYESYSKKAYDRADEIEAQYQGEEFVRTCESMVQRNPNFSKQTKEKVNEPPRVVMAPIGSMIRSGPIRVAPRTISAMQAQQAQQAQPPNPMVAQPTQPPQQAQQQPVINPRRNLIRGFVRPVAR